MCDLDDRVARRGASRVGALLVLGALVLGLPSAAADEPQTAGDLSDLALEDLLGVEVTLATKRAQRLFDSAAAVYVITAEDLRRSGATSLPEALRMVPGLHVARAGSSKWAISARGFTDEFANKLLVLIDGRTVYTPLFAGVYWDSQDVLLEDVERIEVIRGPGAALWGANAVNGVINVVTRPARETTGALLAAGAGSTDRVIAAARYGGAVGTHGHYRAWARYTDRASFVDPEGRDAADAWAVERAGARFEWIGDRDAVELEAETYRGDVGSTTTVSTWRPPYSLTSATQFAIEGSHARSRFEHEFSDGSRAELRVYYDHSERGDALESRGTFDLELQHQMRFGRHRPLFGLGFRRTSDRLGATDVTRFDPARRTVDLFSGFVQDEISLAGDALRLIVGAKLEHNAYTGFELQPSMRAAWFPTPGQVAWGAVSRAMRTPSRADVDLRHTVAVFPAGDVLRQVVVTGDPRVASEELLAWEIGYRVQPSVGFSVDAVAFLNEYDGLRSLEPGPPAPAFRDGIPVVVLPQRIDNGLGGRTWGAEVAANWTVIPGWRLAAAYTYLRVDTWATPGSLDVNPDAHEGDSPRHQVHARSLADLPGGFELDASLYHSSPLPNRGVTDWIRVDLMLGWRPHRELDLRLGVQDVFDRGQLEFDRNVGGRLATEVPRAIYGRVAWRF